MAFRIGNKVVGIDTSTFFIAEIGSNHDGTLERAKELIDRCVEIGADAVKFQSFTAEGLVTGDHPAYAALERLSLPKAWHAELASYCLDKGIIFLSTPFDEERLDLLSQLEVPAYKIASGDLTYYKLLKKVAALRKPVLLSTGIATLDEVKAAVNLLEAHGCAELAILHCVSNYPPQDEDVNLKAITTLREAFPRQVIGFSDHSSGHTAPLAAVVLGARIIEKHITISRKLSGPDHPYALEVPEFWEMIRETRRLEKMLGNGQKAPVQAELPEISWARRGIYAKVEIAKGTILREDMLAFVRPAKGIGAQNYVQALGRQVTRDIHCGEMLEWKDITGV